MDARHIAAVVSVIALTVIFAIAWKRIGEWDDAQEELDRRNARR